MRIILVGIYNKVIKIKTTISPYTFSKSHFLIYIQNIILGKAFEFISLNYEITC